MPTRLKPSPAANAAHLPPQRGPRLWLAAAPALQGADGTRVPLSPLDGVLLAWLALEGPTPRARLATLLWPDSEPESARNSLRQRLFKLRRHCDADLVAGNLTLALAAGVAHDLADADTLLGTAPLALRNELGAWLQDQRQRRSEHRLQQLQARCDDAELAGRWPEGLALAREVLAATPLSEAAHRRLMRLHYLAGDRAAALLAFDRCEHLLKDEVGAQPSTETLTLLQTLQGAGAALTARGSPSSLPASVLRPPRLVGRDAEMLAADAAWARGQVVALVGEAGMGKSRLLQHLLPADALTVAARPGDAGVPLATLARLLRALAERTPRAVAAPARQELARILPEWDDSGAPLGVGRRLQLQRAVASVLAACVDLPALALDDLHFADTASLQMLQALLDDDASPLRWALAYRPAEAGSALHVLNEGLLDQARLHAVALAPLDVAALAALVDSLALPGVDGARLAPGLLARTGGNPLYALETLKQAWVDDQLVGRQGLCALGDTVALPRPLSVMRLVERRLAQLSPPALALARCVAVAGQDFSPRLATHVLGSTTLALADAWAELEQTQILQDRAFVHDLFHEAALASLPAPLARHLHAEIATHLESEGGGAPARLAHHWLDAGQPARAAPQLERAAQDAARALEPAAAAHLWGRLAEVRQRVGEPAAAFAAAEQAVLLLRSATSGSPLDEAITRLQTLASDGLQHARAHELRAAMHHARGDAPAAVASVALGLQALGPDAPVEARVALLNMHGVVLRRGGQTLAARAAFEEALALARAATDADGVDLPAVLNNLGLLLQDHDDHLGAIALMQEAAERQTDPLVRARVINNLAISLEARGHAALAREQCLTAARRVHGAAGVVEINLAVQLGANARYLGRWRDALAHLDEAERLLQTQPHKREDELHRQRAALWLDLGRPNLAREALDRATARTAALPLADAELAGVRARLALLLGQDALPLLRSAEATLQAAAEHRALRRLRLVLAQALPPADALALLQTMADELAVRNNAAAALPVQARLAQALLALQRPAEALRHAQRAADWLQALQPLDITPAEVALTLARCAEAAGDRAQAAQAATQGANAVQTSAALHLDATYREGFLLRNPVHRDLLTLAERLRRPAA